MEDKIKRLEEENARLREALRAAVPIRQSDRPRKPRRIIRLQRKRRATKRKISTNLRHILRERQTLSPLRMLRLT